MDIIVQKYPTVTTVKLSEYQYLEDMLNYAKFTGKFYHAKKPVKIEKVKNISGPLTFTTAKIANERQKEQNSTQL